MEVFFTHASAILFWRKYAQRGFHALDAPRKRTVKDSAVSITQIRDAARLYLPSGSPVHVSIPEQSRRQSKVGDVVFHVRKTPYPSRSFARIAQGVYVASPALAFVQIAPDIDIAHLIEIGYELCGSYSLDASDNRGFYQREPLCDTAELRRFARSATGMAGRKQAERAARYVRNGAASPRESATAMMLTFPRFMGGYALGDPELNGYASSDGDRFAAMHRDRLRCDVLWRKARVALEYESDDFHSNEKAYVKDSRRRNELKLLGIDVVTVTNSELKNRLDMDSIAEGLAKRLGVRTRPLAQGYALRQMELRSKLLDQDARKKLPYACLLS